MKNTENADIPKSAMLYCPFAPRRPSGNVSKHVRNDAKSSSCSLMAAANPIRNLLWIPPGPTESMRRTIEGVAVILRIAGRDHSHRRKCDRGRYDSRPRPDRALRGTPFGVDEQYPHRDQEHRPVELHRPEALSDAVLPSAGSPVRMPKAGHSAFQTGWGSRALRLKKKAQNEEAVLI